MKTFLALILLRFHQDLLKKMFYAKWEEIIEEYTITYNLNGGTLQSPINKYDNTKLPLTLPEPAKEGYIFAGWYQEESFENLINVILEGSSGNITVYAKWIDLNTEYSLTYELNGGNWGFTNKTELITEFFN